MTTSPDKPSRSLVFLEVALALVPFLLIVTHPHLRTLLYGCAYAVFDGARSSLLLILIDPASLLPTFGALARVVFLGAPLVRVFVRAPRHRLAWIPLSTILFIGALGMSLPAFSSVLMWMLLIAASAIAWFLVPRPKCAVFAFLPWLIALEPTLGHSPLGDTYWSTERLTERCAANDGVRPANWSSEYAATRYFGVTPVTPDLVLVTGERRSFWVRRDPDGTPHLSAPMRMMGNMWQGCVRNGTAWLTHRLHILEAPVPREGEPIVEPTRYQVPGLPELGPEVDYVDTICPAKRSTVYSTQLIRGGYLEFDSKTGTTTWHRVIEGLNLQFVERSDGMLVGITTGRLVVFDPEKDQVLQEQPIGTIAMGIDICRQDASIVVTDFAGRVRLYALGSDGRYEFLRGGFYPAARRVSFSPDCNKIAVTSGDDRHLYVVRRSDLGQERKYSLGPGLRDIVFLDDRWLAAADACVVNFIDTTR